MAEKKIPGFVLTLLLLNGCSHYYLPASHLETPEARGQGKVGRVELIGLQSGPSLTATPSSNPSPQLQNAMANYAFGFVGALSDKIDIGVRMQPYAPLNFRGKYQFSGEPESSAKQGNLAASATLSGGILLGGNGASYYMVDAAVPVGYRIWTNHLFSLSPFFTLAGLSGVTIAAPSSGGSTAPTSGSASQYGAALGYQYTIMSLIIRSELAYTQGAFGESQISGIYIGALVGLSL